MPRRDNPSAGKSGRILSPRSQVWQYMALNRETKLASCQLCDKTLTFTGGTTNLRYHLTSAHGMQQFEVVGPSAKVFKPGKTWKGPKETKPKVSSQDNATTPSKSISKADTSLSASPIHTPNTVTMSVNRTPSASSVSAMQILQRSSQTCSPERMAMIIDQVVQLLAQSLQPMSFVSGQAFRTYMKALEPGFEPPDQKVLQTILLAKYEDYQTKLKQRLAREANHFALVYDVWKGSDHENYTTVTVHYLTKDWVRESWVLGTERTSQKPTGHEISSCVRGFMFKYELPVQKIVATVHRQGMLKFQVGKVGNALSCESMSCAAEKLEQCVQSAFSLSDVKSAIDMTGKLATYLIHNDEASKVLQDLKADYGSGHLELVEDRKGAWISTTEMLMKMVALRDTIEKVGDLDMKNNKLYLDEDQWNLVEKVVNSLQILKAALTVVSKEKSGSVSCVLPVVHSILQHCEDISNDTNHPLDKFLRTIGKETREKWDLTAILPSSVPMLSALLDPRFKQLKFIAEDDKSDVTDALKTVLLSTAQTDGISTEPRELSPFLCLFGGDEYAQTERQDADTEISSYIQFPAAVPDMCPLDWWRMNQGRFPELAKLARQYLAVPAITQPWSDIVAGTSRIDMRRALLEVESAGPLIFLNHNWSLVE